MQDLSFDAQGHIQLTFDGRSVIAGVPTAHVWKEDKLYAPISASPSKGEVTLSFDVGQVVLDIEDRGAYIRLSVRDIDPTIDGFIFGPYKTDFPQYGEFLGIAHDGQTAACIQSLNPKTMGGYPEALKDDHPYQEQTTYPPQWGKQYRYKIAAAPTPDGAYLQCYVRNMSRPRCFDHLGFSDAVANVLTGPDASIAGAAIALFACPFSELLNNICRIEVAEGLPHPTIDGEWAKTSPKASASYLNIRYTRETFDQALEWTKRAGLDCLYSGNPFVSWGHFKINPDLTDGGDEGFRDMVAKAAAQGIDMGFHTLSNFIHTNDEYVTPIPHEHLLVMDSTELTRDISADDTTLGIADENNFAISGSVNALRVDDELICFGKLRKTGDTLELTDCERGAFGTTAACHSTGTPVDRLWDHGYKTLFPDVELQNEMARRLGQLAGFAGIKRMSFDGMEGCRYYGLDEYGSSEYARRCYTAWGAEVQSDASTLSHYRWHAHTYLNHGEPFYESSNRSGMVRSRGENQNLYDRNLMPHMLGQYRICPHRGRVEATSPESFEFCMSQSIAYNAGLTLYFGKQVCDDHGMAEEFLDVLRTWNDLRLNGDIPQSLRDRMKDIHADWHLVETDDGWDVRELYVRDQLMPYMTQAVHDDEEFRIVDNAPEYRKTGEFLLIDGAHFRHDLSFRLRVGYVHETGTLSDVEIYPAWRPDRSRIIGFPVTAQPGDYLIYHGGMELERRDADYRLIERVQGKGRPVEIGPSKVEGLQIFYKLSPDADLSLATRLFQITDRIEVKRR